MTSTKPPPIARVEIPWSENGAVRDGAVYRSLAQADAALADAFQREAPPPGRAYDKTAFRVVWTDGQQHEGRADVTRDAVESAPAAGGILRQHLRRFGTWMRDKSGGATWWTPEERAEYAAWGAELLRRLDAEPPLTRNARDIPGDQLLQLGTLSEAHAHLSLLPDPRALVAQLEDMYVGIRPRVRTGGRSGRTVPRSTNRDVTYVTNYLSLALANDLSRLRQLTGRAQSALWDRWTQVVGMVRERLGPNPDAFYTDPVGFWMEMVGVFAAQVALAAMLTRNGASATVVPGWSSSHMPSGRTPCGCSHATPARNAQGTQLDFRPVGRRGEPYPRWVTGLRDESGVYVIRERQADGSAPIVYVGSSREALYATLTRHFQSWRRWKGFWRGQYGEGHDPGLTYARDRAEVAVIVTDADDARALEIDLIGRLAPRDNVLGQPTDDDEWWNGDHADPGAASEAPF